MFFQSGEKKLQSSLSLALANSPKWFGVTANKTSFANSIENRQWNLTDQTGRSFSFGFAPVDQKMEIQFGENQKVKWQKQAPREVASELHNFFFDQLIQYELENLKAHALLQVPDTITTKDEDRAHEWLRVSFEVLKKALQNHPDALFQGQLFAGEPPNAEIPELRLIVYSIDLHLKLQPNGILEVVMFHFKPGEEKTRPDLKGHFKDRKKEVTDLVIGLLNEVQKGFKL